MDKGKFFQNIKINYYRKIMPRLRIESLTPGLQIWCSPFRANQMGSVLNTRALHAVPMLVCKGPSFYLKIYVKKGHNSKTLAFRFIPLVLQLHLVMMSKYSKFGVDTINNFLEMSTLKFLHINNDLAITINRWVKNCQTKNKPYSIQFQ